MSGFDGLFRTQAYTGGLRMEGARLQEQRRQFDVQAYQNQMQLNQRQTESDARVAAWEQARQLDSYKLQIAMGIDQAKQSRLATEQAELAVQASRFELEEARKRSEGSDLDSRKTMEEIRKIRLSSMGANPEERLASGYVPDADDPLGWRKAKDDSEAETARAGYVELQTMLKSGDFRERDRTSTELHRELGLLSNPVSRAMLTPDQRKAADERAQFLQEQWRQNFGGKEGGPPPPGPGAKAPAQQSVGPVDSPFDRGSLPDSIWHSDRWAQDPFWKGLAEDVDESGRPITRDVMAYTMASFGPLLAEYKGWQGSVDALMFSAAEKDPEVLGFLLKTAPTADGGDRSDEDIRRILKSRFPGRAHAIDETMKRVQGSIEWVLERERLQSEGGDR